MNLTKQNIIDRINQLLITYKVDWKDVVIDLDMAIEEINSYLSTRYPLISKVLNDRVSPEITYSYRAGGEDIDFFPQKYFHTIVIPFVIVQILTRDEEFTTVFSKYSSMYQENLFVMARDEMSEIPAHLISVPKGVYFANPDPAFKYNPETYFNRKIEMDVPKIRVEYSWGDLAREGFVARPLPIDPNAYEMGYFYSPVIMQTNDFLTLVVDNKQNVIGTFTGWSFEKEGIEREIITEGFNIFQDVKLYAVFNYDIIRFKYLGNGGALNNWRPLYISRNSLVQDIRPLGGTATRRGYSFIGFDPIKINQQDITIGTGLDEITFDDGFDSDELSLINNTEEIPTIEFTAQWARILYKLTFMTPTFQGRSGYIFGEEFDILPPDITEDFIGWWDNKDFIGDPVTKIYESDYGDKIFYAKYNRIAYIITFKDESGLILIQESIPKNTDIPIPNDLSKPNAYINGLLYSYHFEGWFDTQETPVKLILNRKAFKEEIFVASFLLQEVQSTIIVNYKDSLGGYEITQFNFHGYQVGETIKKSEIILALRNNKRTIEGTDYDTFLVTEPTVLTYYVNDFSLTADGEPISGDEFIVPIGNLELFGLYTSDFFALTFYQENFVTSGEKFTAIGSINVPRGLFITDILFHTPFSLEQTPTTIPK